MEPDGEFYGDGVGCFLPTGGEFSEAVGDVVEVVVGEIGSGVGGLDFWPMGGSVELDLGTEGEPLGLEGGNHGVCFLRGIGFMGPAERSCWLEGEVVLVPRLL